MMLASPKSRVLTLGLLPIILVVVGVAAYLFGRGWSVPQALPAAGAVPNSPAIEAKWGVRVTQIGVTADGGMVDFRYVVLDPDKALAMVQDVKNVPVLVPENGGSTVNSAALMPAKHNLTPGQTYFFLYRNTNGAIKAGTPVTVKFGDLTLEHLIAR